MKIFGVSLMTVLIVLVAYWLGASFPGPVNVVKSKF